MGQVTVQDWMHRGVMTCHPDAPVDEVAETLDAKDISALVVVDGAGDAIGVISRTDLVNGRRPVGREWDAPDQRQWRRAAAYAAAGADCSSRATDVAACW